MWRASLRINKDVLAQGILASQIEAYSCCSTTKTHYIEDIVALCFSKAIVMMKTTVFVILAASVMPSSIAHDLVLPLNYTVVSSLDTPNSIHCNESSSWLPENFSTDDMYPDCVEASRHFLREADIRMGEQFEFHDLGVTPSSQLQQLLTPMRYTFSLRISLPFPRSSLWTPLM